MAQSKAKEKVLFLVVERGRFINANPRERDVPNLRKRKKKRDSPAASNQREEKGRLPYNPSWTKKKRASPLSPGGKE